MKKTLSALGLLGAVGLIVSAVSIPASASPVEPLLQDEPSAERTSVLEADFSHHVALPDALEAAETYPGEVVGVRFENDQVVGEYFTDADKTPEQFLEQFDEMYGTQPEISSLLVEVDYRAPANPNARTTAPAYEPLPTVPTVAPEFIAPRVTVDKAVELREGNRGDEAANSATHV